MKREIGTDGTGETGIAAVSSRPIVPSHLPSFLLPCPHCSNRMVVKAVTPVPVDGSSGGSDLDDITYACVQCGTTLTRTVRA
jgi:DNA-directed RNA polymerase subunit RPC12/RpoP